METTFKNSNINIRGNSNQTSPVVILFGWADGNFEHLNKYRELFESKDYTTVCVRTSMINSVFRMSTAGWKESMDVRNVLEEILQNNPERPVFLYAFSNGGLSVQYMMVKDMDSNSFPGKNIKGMIFDSCPIKPDLSTSTTSALELYTKPINNLVLKFLLSCIVKMAIYVVVKTDKDLDKVITNIKNSKITSPQLFLFSKDDKLAPYQDILDVIDARKKIGIQVTYKLWDCSRHVCHMKMHTEEYVEMVESFVDECLSSDVIIKGETEKLDIVDDEHTNFDVQMYTKKTKQLLISKL